ncbi:hypothetical protein CTEN210_02538 [Chaetoceros tenuissimus]|uniref:Costars domain-containing protein n=1 Tax=Chaetoceros tenuissimus TaxID=426638 RepID=A0AAD3CJS3_9STRA|nr:hypothetical protein CTEN210_02538 [Chaetoceros tenuissimus]
MNEHEKRVEEEVQQLLMDIKRIQPEGETFCAFGDLFSDEQVEQYYEALVGTLKAAKKKGLIHFKGQILLKGMHDNVKVSIQESREEEEPEKSNSTSNLRETKDCKAEEVSFAARKKMTATVIEEDEAKNTESYKEEAKDLLKERTDRKKLSSTSLSTLGSAPETPRKVQIPSFVSPRSVQRVMTPLTTPRTKYSVNVQTDEISINSYATVPTPTISRISMSSPAPKKVDVLHTSQAGTAFQSKSISETLEGRLDREISQLLVDIKRIQPEGETFCAFGDLFSDEQVEQYYEALVGTLKAAKKKGLIHFKGQILLKGMHDNVRVSIKS